MNDNPQVKSLMYASPSTSDKNIHPSFHSPHEDIRIQVNEGETKGRITRKVSHF